jgi:hypothetical protein
MSYTKSDGDIILHLSQEDYATLLLLLGHALHTWPGSDQEKVDFLNRLNAGNPDYTPYIAVKWEHEA